MIRPLRRAHRVVAIVLALGLPSIVAAALATRREVPVNGASAAPPPDTGALADWRRAAVPEWKQQLAGLPAPDVMVYWASAAPNGGRLPDGAVLLGPAPGWLRERLVPATLSGGHLLLFSVARGDVIDTARLEVKP